MNRTDTLKRWVENNTYTPVSQWIPLFADASVRQYYRARCGTTSYVVMDTPVDLVPVEPFVSIARQLKRAGLLVPEIFAVAEEEGFVLLSDLGDISYQTALQTHDPKMLYLRAIDALLLMQTLATDALPVYDSAFLRRELAICEEWYINKHLHTILEDDAADTWARSVALLIARISSQPSVFMHRDYHCRNLMWVNETPGILDFQDAVKGPVTYDLVSLLRDAYIDWPEEFVLDLAIRYWEKAREQGLAVAQDFSDFYRDFEWTGLQRHLKILGIFTRLYHRDGKAGYLADIPRVLNYIYKVTERYAELHGLRLLFARLHDTQIEAGYTF